MFTFKNVGSLAKSLNGSFNNSMIASFAYFINLPPSCVVYGAVIRDGIPKGCVSSVCVQCVSSVCVQCVSPGDRQACMQLSVRWPLWVGLCVLRRTRQF